MLLHLGMRAALPMAIVTCVLSQFGCTKQPSQAIEDSAHAKYVLVTALEAWKQGQAKSLATRKPAIRFADDDELAGLKLIDYEFENEANPILPFQNVPISLVLKDRRGETVEKSVTYQIGVEPTLTVLRSDN